MPVPLVLLPGMNCSARLWNGVAGELVTRPADGPAREVVVVPLERPTLDDQVEALLDGLPQRFAIGGVSLGAIVAMAVRRRAPERVAGLLLTATNARSPTDAQRSGWTAQLAALGAGATPRDLQEELLPLLVGADATPALREETLRMADEVGVAALTAQLELQLTRVDERPALADTSVPCTVVAAAGDLVCPLERHTEMHRLVSGSDLVVIPAAPHLVTMSNPRQVAEAVTAWLRRVDG
jgi:pimeloyl-ACP methyl ester carboxylesterase